MIKKVEYCTANKKTSNSFFVILSYNFHFLTSWGTRERRYRYRAQENMEHRRPTGYLVSFLGYFIVHVCWLVSDGFSMSPKLETFVWRQWSPCSMKVYMLIWVSFQRSFPNGIFHAHFVCRDPFLLFSEQFHEIYMWHSSGELVRASSFLLLILLLF